MESRLTRLTNMESEEAISAIDPILLKLDKMIMCPCERGQKVIFLCSPDCPLHET